MVKKWFESYLVSRQQRIMVKQHLSDYFQLESGLPQGSCLGPVLFLIYASGLFKVAAKHLTNIHTCADDTQLYLSFKPTFQQNAVNTIEKCITDVRSCREGKLCISQSTNNRLLGANRPGRIVFGASCLTFGNAQFPFTT